jgi:hypothetical protein
VIFAQLIMEKIYHTKRGGKERRKTHEKRKKK